MSTVAKTKKAKSVYIDEELHYALKIKAASERRDLQELVNTILARNVRRVSPATAPKPQPEAST